PSFLPSFTQRPVLSEVTDVHAAGRTRRGRCEDAVVWDLGDSHRTIHHTDRKRAAKHANTGRSFSETCSSRNPAPWISVTGFAVWVVACREGPSENEPRMPRLVLNVAGARLH